MSGIHEPSAAPQKRRPGPRLPDGWETVFLTAVKEHGGFYRAARAAGVHPTTAWRRSDSDPAFAQAVHDAREEHADQLEHELEVMARERGNPVGHIVRLKALRPAQYIEKQATLSINLDGPAMTADMARELLASMLREATEPTRQALAAATEPARRILGAGPEEPSA